MTTVTELRKMQLADQTPAETVNALLLGAESTSQKPQGIKIEPITRAELDTAEIHPRVIVPNRIFADLANFIGAGGGSKTTLLLDAAIKGSLMRELWGQTPPRAFRTVFVTREDSRKILVARLREIIKANGLSESEIRQVLSSVAIIDLTGENFRLSMVAGDVVMPNTTAINELVEAVTDFGPDWFVFDPLVSFGVGESRVNDNEQGIIEAFRIIRNRLDCCVEGIHHTGKANARDKTTDQYSGRGGSALADGSRMVRVLNPLSPAEWLQATGTTLARDESGLVMSLPKLSYCTPQEAIYIRRRGYLFESVTVNKRSPEQESAAITEQVFRFLCDQYAQGRHYSKSDLDSQTETLSLTRGQIRAACTELKVSGRVLYHEVKGKGGSHYQPIITAKVGDTHQNGGNDELAPPCPTPAAALYGKKRRRHPPLVLPPLS